ncbi:MAG: hypothetical protein WBV69_08170 [Candidatus Sulfotelmatobacter sp.]
MIIRRCLVASYRMLLCLYPPAFRKRFAEEMLELAQEAEASEWALIFGDTCIAIMRCWLEGSPSTAALAETNAYLGLGGSPAVWRWGLLQGFVLSIAILVGLCYFSHWTAYRECPGTSSERARR